MCARNFEGGRRRENYSLTELTLDSFAAWVPDDFLRRLTFLYMCGNYGDPIVARDCLAVYEHIRRAAPGLALGLNTNGSARDAAFWQALARLRVAVRFGIDGATAAAHERYRRGTEFGRILDNAAAFIAAGGEATWDMLIFAHNAGEVDAAREMAGRMGFRRFLANPTDRFAGQDSYAVRDAAGEVIDRLEPAADAPPPARTDPLSCAIRCKVAADLSVYIAANGTVFPCCWLAQRSNDRPGRPGSGYDQPDLHGRIASLLDLLDDGDARRFDLRHRSLADIVDRSFRDIPRRWAPGPGRLMECAHVCGAP